MKMIFIDAVNRMVRQIDREPTLETYYELIGCKLIDAVRFEDGDIGYVDDEGLLVNPENFIFLKGMMRHPTAGNMVIIGTDDEGEDQPPILSVDDILAKIEFLHILELHSRISEFE